MTTNKRETEEKDIKDRKKSSQKVVLENEQEFSSSESESEDDEVVLETDSSQGLLHFSISLDELSDIDDDTELHSKMKDLKVYLPGVQMEKDEELVVDQSTYEMLHALNVEWPCLSFDILRDQLGDGRDSFPMSVYLVAGSQAETYEDNKIYVMKMASLSKTKNDDDSDASDDEDEDPVLEFKTINHEGSINRIRVICLLTKAMPHPEVHIVASMAETGKVHIFDIFSHVNSFDTPGLNIPHNTLPTHTITHHGTREGYGIDWSPIQAGSLLTGDCTGKIYLTRKSSSGFSTEKIAYTGHTSSIEDIQWSPSQSSVFASCSADQTVCIWDTRTKSQAQLCIKAHDSDVNVISWNKNVDYLLASGSDSGVFSIWDLRAWPTAVKERKTPETAASFSWHTKPITSIEWHPKESSVLAVAGDDDQLTIWDLALERDEEDETLMGTNAAGLVIEVPPQLLFVHQGQKSVKELHWHTQAPGVILSTAFDGFNVFKTFNM